MGVFDFFRRRRERESAVSLSELEAASAPSPQPIVESSGEEPATAGERPISVNLGSGQPDVAEVVGMVGEALRTGSFQVSQHESRTIDLTDSGLRDQILGAMREAGVDLQADAGEEVNAGDHAGLQDRILRALSEHGVDVGSGPDDREEPGGNGSG